MKERGRREAEAPSDLSQLEGCESVDAEHRGARPACYDHDTRLDRASASRMAPARHCLALLSSFPRAKSIRPLAPLANASASARVWSSAPLSARAAGAEDAGSGKGSRGEGGRGREKESRRVRRER